MEYFNFVYTVVVVSVGLSFHALYRSCREQFLVNTDATLRAQLTEFRDHKLIRYKKVTLNVID